MPMPSTSCSSEATTASRSNCPVTRLGCSATNWSSKNPTQPARRPFWPTFPAPICVRSKSAENLAAMVSFALDWLTGLYGAEVRKAVKRTSVTRWDHDPWTFGAFSIAVPGGQGARAALAEPVRDRIFFAGEATHETQWGTVGGAWASGERAAELALKRLGFIEEPRSSRRR